MEWSTACPDWGERLKRGESIIPPPLFPEMAEAALDVFKQLQIVDATGSPTFGDAAAPWILDLVASIFGAYDPESGRRLITEWFVLIPKKNGKSTLAAGVMLTALILNWRLSAEFAILAPTVEIANNTYGPARDMTQRDDDLSTLMHVQTHIKSITHRETNATLKVLAADAKTVGGKKTVGTLVEELHEFGTMHNAANMMREAKGGLMSRPEGFVIYITTQSSAPPAGIFKEKLDYARDVRDGKIIDPKFVPVIFEHPDDITARKEHLLLKNLPMVNPNFGFSVDAETLEREFAIAQNTGENSFRDFMAKHGNVEIGLNLRSDRWAGADFWEGAVAKITLDDLIERCEVIDIGIDGGGLDDLLGVYFIGRVKDSAKKMGCGYAWAHPSVLERRKEIAPRLHDFFNDGDLTLVEKVGDDVEELADMCHFIYQSGLLDKIGCDPVGIGAVLDKLEERGIPNDKIVGVSQGWKLGGAIKTAERWIAGGEFSPSSQPIMAWCVGNARVEPRANSIIITKQASGTGKIDPLMAMFNAITLMSLNPAPANKKLMMFSVG